MDEQSQVTFRVRRYRTLAEAEQLVAAFDASGLNPSEFSREHEMSVDTLNRYLHKRARGQSILRNPEDGKKGNAARTTAPQASGASNLVAVEVSEPAAPPDREDGSGLTVILPGGCRIEVGCRFDAQTLAQLLRVLEQR
jgi:hypothetical protein